MKKVKVLLLNVLIIGFLMVSLLLILISLRLIAFETILYVTGSLYRDIRVGLAGILLLVLGSYLVRSYFMPDQHHPVVQIYSTSLGTVRVSTGAIEGYLRNLMVGLEGISEIGNLDFFKKGEEVGLKIRIKGYSTDKIAYSLKRSQKKIVEGVKERFGLEIAQATLIVSDFKSAAEPEDDLEAESVERSP